MPSLSSRRIGQAIGLVMANRQVDEQTAFEILKKASQNSNRKMRELANDLAQTADLSELRRS